jgi:hypothetical protein
LFISKSIFFNPLIPTGQLKSFRGNINIPETPPAIHNLIYSDCNKVNLLANLPDAEKPFIINF